MTNCIPLDCQKLQAIYDHHGMHEFASRDYEWSEGICPPTDADELAREVIFVVCNSGMKNTVARPIFERVMTALDYGKSASTVFGHKGKTAAIDRVWEARFGLLGEFLALASDDARLAWCERLPWIGGITKFHLAKNLGVDCAKPDVHLQRLADLHGETVDGLCGRLAGEIGWRKATVDVILWRACALGVINSRTGEVRAA